MTTKTQEEIERRALTASGQLELRALEEDGKVVGIRGHAVAYDRLSDPIAGMFVEKIARGAFADSIAGGDVVGLWNHDTNHVLGRTRSGTMRLKDDDVGLAFEIDLPDTSTGRDLAESIRRGDVSGVSFGFRTIEDKWERQPDGSEIRTVLRAELHDVSPVTFPAYPQTDVALRSRDAWLEEEAPPAWERELEERRRQLELAERGG